MPNPVQFQQDLWSIWGNANDGGTIAHYDGAGWTKMISPTTIDLYGVFGTGPDNVFICGA